MSLSPILWTITYALRRITRTDEVLCTSGAATHTADSRWGHGLGRGSHSPLEAISESGGPVPFSLDSRSIRSKTRVHTLIPARQSLQPWYSQGQLLHSACTVSSQETSIFGTSIFEHTRSRPFRWSQGHHPRCGILVSILGLKS
jgi:hypothetical protein